MALELQKFLLESRMQGAEHFSRGLEPQFTFVTRQLQKTAQTIFRLQIALWRGSERLPCWFLPSPKSLHRAMRNSLQCLWRLSALPSRFLRQKQKNSSLTALKRPHFCHSRKVDIRDKKRKHHQNWKHSFWPSTPNVSKCIVYLVQKYQ